MLFIKVTHYLSRSDMLLVKVICYLSKWHVNYHSNMSVIKMTCQLSKQHINCQNDISIIKVSPHITLKNNILLWKMIFHFGKCHASLWQTMCHFSKWGVVTLANNMPLEQMTCHFSKWRVTLANDVSLFQSEMLFSKVTCHLLK